MRIKRMPAYYVPIPKPLSFIPSMPLFKELQKYRDNNQFLVTPWKRKVSESRDLGIHKSQGLRRI